MFCSLRSVLRNSAKQGKLKQPLAVLGLKVQPLLTKQFGEVQEWLNWPLSKSGVAQVTEGSNPSLSAKQVAITLRLVATFLVSHTLSFT